MPPLAGAYVFVLGLASGIALLAFTSYRHASPAWLRWVLFGCSLLMVCRYVAMAHFALSPSPEAIWHWRYAWRASAIGLALPGIFVIDQLLRDPRMSPKVLLIRFSPLLAVSVALLLAPADAVPDRLLGWMPHLHTPWRLAASTIQALFVAGYVVWCALIMHKVPSAPIRRALAGLVVGYLWLAADGLILAFGGWYVRPFLYSEMFTLLALWHAYDTAFQLQQVST